MKQYVLLSLLFTLLCSCDADDNVHTEVPSVVLNAFHREYSQALQVGWQQRDTLYEVDFEINDRDHSALVNAEGKIVGKKKEISVDKIPPKVISGLTRNFKMSDLGDPELVELNGRIVYQLELDKFLFDEKIVLDEAGKLITNIPYWE